MSIFKIFIVSYLLENKPKYKFEEEHKFENANEEDIEIHGIGDLPLHKKPVFDRPDTINNGKRVYSFKLNQFLLKWYLILCRQPQK